MQYVPPIGATGLAPYINGNPSLGIEGSPVPAEAIEHPMREIMTVIESAGIEPSQSQLNQLLQAIIWHAEKNKVTPTTLRGSVMNALNSQGSNYTLTAAGINNPGTGYATGDAVFIVSDRLIDAVLIVEAVDANGAITTVSIADSGKFTATPAGTVVTANGGHGSGATVDVTATLAANDTLWNIDVGDTPDENAKHSGDFVYVLQDELHGNQKTIWMYQDKNGDGTFNWVFGGLAASSRIFFEEPISWGEIDPTLLLPAGTVFYFTGINPPAGAIVADGALLSRTAYPRIWTHAQNSGNLWTESEWSAGKWGGFSTGNGSTTFRAPDLRGEFPRGADLGRGVDAGRVLGSAQSDAIRNITGRFHGSGAVSGPFSYVGDSGGTFPSMPAEFHFAIIDFIASRAVPTAAENRPRSVALLPCIKI